MTREDTKKILDKVLDMGISPLHYVAVDFDTDPDAVFCSIYIHLNAPDHLVYGRDVCGYKGILTQSDDVQPALDFLNVWAEIFRKERELDEADGR